MIRRAHPLRSDLSCRALDAGLTIVTETDAERAAGVSALSYGFKTFAAQADSPRETILVRHLEGVEWLSSNAS